MLVGDVSASTNVSLDKHGHIKFVSKCEPRLFGCPQAKVWTRLQREKCMHAKTWGK